MDPDEWQEMPVVQAGRRKRGGATGRPDSDSDDHDLSDWTYGPTRQGQHRSQGSIGGASKFPSRTAHSSANATGQSLHIDDARGYDWRSKPAGAPGMHISKEDRARQSGDGTLPNNDDDDSDEESDDEKGQGYTQLRLDEDVEGDELHAATEYLFGDSRAQGGSRGPVESSVGYSYQNESDLTPLSQMSTTKSLLSEPQKIAYVGLCALKAKEMVRSVRRIPGSAKELAASLQSIEEWELRVLARLFQHMDISASEQSMIKSLGEHGVLASDLAPSLVTTQKIENPDYDPIAAQEKQMEEERIAEGGESPDATPVSPKAPELDTAPDSRESEAVSEKSGSGEQKSPQRDAASVEEAPKALASSSDEAEGDGDIGDMFSVATSSTAQNHKESEARPKSTKAQSEADDDADITTLVAESSDSEEGHDDVPTPETAAAAKTVIKPTEEPQSQRQTTEASSEAHTVLADPNTAAQSAAADANITAAPVKDSGSKNFGLTSEPQTVEPPPNALPGVTTELSTTDTHITLDLRWTILCDLFLILTADSVYDSRSRVLLEKIAEQLGLSWMDVTKFEKRVTDALEIEEGVEKLKDKSTIQRREKEALKKKWAMVGLATVGGGLVIGLSAGLAAPLVGVGLAGLLGGVGVGGTSAFLSGVGGAVLITTTGTAAGAALGGRGMTRRTQSVKTFMFKPIHNNKRINCIVAVPGFMNGAQDDVRLPFSVIDSIMGDVFSVLWEPEMMREMGNAINILWNETIVMGVQQVLAATIAGGLLGALAWPLWLTKLGYLIDNPWSNALTRAEAAGKILADTLARRQLGVRPITLVGFSLGARVIFYALCELAKKKAFGVVQNVYLFGAPVTASDRTWKEARSVVAGRFVNGFSSTDWILGYLFRATSGGLRSIAGLHPVERVPDVENVDVTTSVPGHLQYRAFMPLVLSEVGFRVTQDWFDEPEDLSKIPDREVVLQEMEHQKQEMELKTVKTSSGGFGKIWKRKGTSGSTEGGGGQTSSSSSAHTSRPDTPADPNAPPKPSAPTQADDAWEDDDLPPREPEAQRRSSLDKDVVANPDASSGEPNAGEELVEDVEAARRPGQSTHVDTEAMLAELRESGIEVKELQSSLPALSINDRQASESTQVVSSAGTRHMEEGSDLPTAGARAHALPDVGRSLPAASPKLGKTGLKASFSSFFARKGSVGPSSPSVRESSKAQQLSAPALKAPSGVYTTSGQPSPSAEQEAALTPHTERPSFLSTNSAGSRFESDLSANKSTIDVSEHPATILRPVPGPELPSTSDDAFASAGPAAFSAAVAPEEVNLSFASDFDEDEEGGQSESPALTASATHSNDVVSKANTYGLSAEAARQLAQQFSGSPQTSQNHRGDTTPTREGSAGGWLGSSSDLPAADSAPTFNTNLGWNDHEDALGPSTPMPRPLETSYGSSIRAAAGSDGFVVPNSGAGPRTPGTTGGMNFAEATDNPWG
ncbi:unnamed protein product [Parajaminaea phylloscopi]